MEEAGCRPLDSNLLIVSKLGTGYGAAQKWTDPVGAKSPPIDLLTTLARFGRDQRMSLRDPNLGDLFAGVAKEQLAAALANDALLHGHRTQKMFEALVVSLGQYELLKTEDTGVVHPSGKYTAPDFRAVLDGGAQWLIEVKNVYDKNAARQRFRIREQDVAQLRRYADKVQCPLKFALYWGRWHTWTLIDANVLTRVGSKVGIDMFKAVPLNELSRLGDRMIGTKPPLKLRFIADPSKPRSVSPDGKARMRIGGTAIYCGNVELTDPIDRNTAWILMEFGEWTDGEPRAIVNGAKLEAIEIQWKPLHRSNESEEFEIVGSLSSMFSQYYATFTLGEHGVTQTEANLVPGLFAPLVATDSPSIALPLWRFSIQPNNLEKPP
jgi:hypothetical protein